MNNTLAPITKKDLIKRNQTHINKFMQNPLVFATAVVMTISLLLLLMNFIIVSRVDNPESPYFNVDFKNTPYMSFFMVSSPLAQIAIIASFFALHHDAKNPSSAGQALPLSSAVLIISVAVCVVDTIVSFSYKNLMDPTIEPGVSALFNAFSKDTTFEDTFLKLPFLSVNDMFKNIGMISLFRTVSFSVFAIFVIVSQMTPYYANYGAIIYGIFCFVMIFPAFFFFILSFYPSYYPSVNPAEPLPPNDFVPLKPDYIFIAQRLFTYIGYLLQTVLALKLFSHSLSAGWMGRKIKAEENDEKNTEKKTQA